MTIKNTTRLVTLCCLASCSLYNKVWAHTTESKQKSIETITVTGQAMRTANKSFTVNVIDRDILEQRNISDVLRAMEETAGMTMSTGAYAQGGVASAFQMRGFAGGGHGSDAAVYIDGISLNEGGSHGDGYADTNVIMPIELESFSIYKGPISPLYGNFARAGTLAFETRKGGNYQDADIYLGAFNTVNAQMAMGSQLDKLTTNFAVQSYDSAGYREHQEYTKVNATGRLAYEIADDSQIAVSVRRHSGHFNSPGYIEQQQFDLGKSAQQDRAPTAENDGGNRNFSSYRIDYNTMINADIRLLTYVYGVEQDSVRFAKFSYSDSGQTERIYQRDGAAFGASLNGANTLVGIDSNWAFGVEYLDETTDAARYNSKDRIRGDVIQNRKLTTKTSSLFGQLDMSFNDQLSSTLGLRYDTFDGDALNRIDGVTSTMQDYSHISPKFGSRYQVNEFWQVRASVANGFALPSGEAKYDASIQVEPIDYWQYEVGVTGSPLSDVKFDLALFSLDSSGEYQQIGGETVVFGKTRRTGIEAEMRYFVDNHLELIALFGQFDSELQEGINQGKAVTGVPKQITTLKANYTPDAGVGGSLTWRQTGEYFITEDNQQTYQGFDVLDMTVFYQIPNNNHLKLYAQFNNLLDKAYAEAVWYGDGINYAPASGRNFGLGITVKL